MGVRHISKNPDPPCDRSAGVGYTQDMRSILALVFLALVETACLVNSCPDVDCVDLLQVELHGGDDGLAEGTYAIDIDLPDEIIEIQCIQAAGMWECENTDDSGEARSVLASYASVPGPLVVSIEGGFGGGSISYEVSVSIEDQLAHEGAYEADFSRGFNDGCGCERQRQRIEL